MSDILILGYYGFGNSGDDTLLLSVIQQLKKAKKDINMCVLSANPDETRAKYRVSSVSRNNPLSILKALLNTKELLVGGGTLIQDRTSTKSLLYYLFVIRLSELLGKRVMLYANGIGPLKKNNLAYTRHVLNKVDVITLRDRLSQEELKKAGITKPSVILSADSVFGLEFEKKDIKTDIPKPYFCISVRATKNIKEGFTDDMARLIDNISAKYHAQPVFLPFQKSKDSAITNIIRDKMKYESSVFDTDCDIEDLLSFISGAKILIGMRLHSLIYSAICHVPLSGIVYDPKVEGIMDYLGQNMYLRLEDFDYDKFYSLCCTCFDNRETIIKELDKKCADMKTLAASNADYAVRLLEEKNV